jgi:hypothetical protein
MGVKHKKKLKYEFRIAYPSKSGFEFGIIVFEKEWFLNLKKKVRCATLAHEIEHSKTQGNRIVLVLIPFIAWLFVYGIIP